LEHRAALWTFVDRDDVEPTNNHAYAARGISVVMPRPGLCRVRAEPVARTGFVGATEMFTDAA